MFKEEKGLYTKGAVTNFVSHLKETAAKKIELFLKKLLVSIYFIFFFEYTAAHGACFNFMTSPNGAHPDAPIFLEVGIRNDN